MSDNLVEQLEKLSKLHDAGMLSEEEFVQAKSKLLNSESTEHEDADVGDTNTRFNYSSPQGRDSLPSHFQNLSSDDDLGRAANRWVSLQTVMAIIGVILFCIMGLFMCSKMDNQKSRFPSTPTFPE